MGVDQLTTGPGRALGEVTVVDPRIGDVVGRVACASHARCADAVAAARGAAGGWAGTPAAERCAALHAAADAVAAAADELAAMIERETGKPLENALGRVAAGVSTLNQYAELGPLHRGSDGSPAAGCRGGADAVERPGGRGRRAVNGGNDALVDAGVGPDWAAAQAALGSFANAGQICVPVERIYVHETIAEPFLMTLVAEADVWSTWIGPLVDRRHRDHMHRHVADATADGTVALAGGSVPGGDGAYYPLTVLSTCRPEMPVMREETFGPVAPVQVVPDFATGLLEACDGAYGLAASVLPSGMAHAQQAWRALPVGTVKINMCSVVRPGERRSRGGGAVGASVTVPSCSTSTVWVSAALCPNRAITSA